MSKSRVVGRPTEAPSRKDVGMKVSYNNRVRRYPHTITDFLKVFNHHSLEVTARRGYTDFDWLVKQISSELNMAQTDVVRSISVLLRKSRTFRLMTWRFVSYSAKGSKRMLKASGWAPRAPFDFITSNDDFTEEQIKKMVGEVHRR